MTAYLYHSNVSPRDRFEQFEMQLDNGSTALIRRGRAYDLSASEVTRATRFIVLAPTSVSNDTPIIIERLPVIGTPEEGDIPVWRSAYGAFVAEPNVGGGGGGGSGMPSTAADTGESIRYIALVDGTRRVVPIPFSTPVPSTPTSLAVEVHLAANILSWSGTADHFDIYRDGVKFASSTSNRYRDLTVVVGSTYVYRVRAVDQYGQWSALSNSATGFVNAALNSAPTVAIGCWPLTLRSSGKSIVRVMARDVDAQSLELELGVNTGTLTATSDPSVFIYTAP